MTCLEGRKVLIIGHHSTPYAIHLRILFNRQRFSVDAITFTMAWVTLDKGADDATDSLSRTVPLRNPNQTIQGMKSNMKTKRQLRPVMFGLALACSASMAQAQGVDDYVVDQFTNSIGGWAYNYGSATNTTIEWDGTEDSGPGASPGSMKVTIDFDLCTGENQSDFESVMADVVDLTKYTTMHFSMKVDTNSSMRGGWGAGTFGDVRAHIRQSDWGGDANFTDPTAASVGADAYVDWVDYSLPIDQLADNLATRQAAGILGFDIWSGWGDCTDFPTNAIGHTNTVVFWMDNIWFEWNTNTAPADPPTLALEKSGSSGVRVQLSELGNQWQRDAVVTPANAGNYFWGGGGATPVTYSFTIADFPDPVPHEGFQAHMFIINADTTDGSTGFNATYGGADWNVPDIAIVQLTSTTNETYDLVFSYKTNQADQNPTAIPATVTNIPSPLGTWSLSFTHNTNVTMSGPGVSTNFTIPEDAVLNNFSPVESYIQFGFHKNDDENDGHNDGASGTYDRLQKTGGSVVFDDTFNGAELTNNYAWRVTSESAVQFIPAGTAWELSWTLPAVGFIPESAVDAGGPWGDAGASSTYTSGGAGHALIPTSALPSTDSTLFRMKQLQFTKLQILLPGETAAPGTPSGKTGTPTAVNALDSVNLTVRAVDDDWNLISGINDEVSFTSTDGLAFLPDDGPLTSGQGTFEMFFDTAGSQTVTVTNVTDPSILPDTSSSITVN